MLTATGNINLPTTEVSIITAIASFDLPGVGQAASLLINGERVSHIEVTAAYSGVSWMIYFTQSGRRPK